MRVLVALLAIAAAAHAFSPAPPRTTTTSTTALDANRRQALGGLVAAAAAAVTLATPLPAFAAPEVLIEVKNEGKGPKPQKGELAAIRFKAMAGNNVIDDIYDTPEPYYTRIGSGGMLKGVEQTLLDMRVGDRWVLTIPVRSAHVVIVNVTMIM